MSVIDESYFRLMQPINSLYFIKFIADALNPELFPAKKKMTKPQNGAVSFLLRTFLRKPNYRTIPLQRVGEMKFGIFIIIFINFNLFIKLII